MFIILLWKAVCSLKSETTLMLSSLFVFMKNFYGLSSNYQFPISTEIILPFFLGRTLMSLDVNRLSLDLEKESCSGSVSLLSLTLASLRHFPNVLIL